MKLLNFAGLLLAAADDSLVRVLTKANFQSVIEEFKEGILVEYYAPWCGHCKALAPEYDKAAKMMSEKPKLSKFALGKVDATEEPDLASDAGVSGYPTLKWFVNGKPQDYEGGRTADTIVEWIEIMTGPAVRDEDVPEDEKFHIIYEGAEIPDWYSSAASGDRKKKFYFKKGSAEVVSIKHPGEDAVVGSEVKTASDLEALIEKNKLPVFGPITGETFSAYGESKQGLVWLLPKLDSAEDAEKVDGLYRELAVALKAKAAAYNVAWTDTIAFAEPVKGMFGIEEFPAVAFQPEATKKPVYIYRGPLETEKILAFYQTIEDGTAESFLKTEDIPVSNDEPVKVVVGKQFKELVFQADRDVLLEVYAPWCGHCKKLDPEWNKVAAKIQKDGFSDHIMLAKLDGTANDSPDNNFSWTGFPSIFWIKAGADKPVSYDGPRDAKGIWKWLKKNASKSEEINAQIKASKEAKAETKKEEL